MLFIPQNVNILVLLYIMQTKTFILDAINCLTALTYKHNIILKYIHGCVYLYIYIIHIHSTHTHILCTQKLLFCCLATVVVKGVLPGLRLRTGLLPSGPKSSFLTRASLVFNLETKVLESGGRVKKLIAQVA